MALLSFQGVSIGLPSGGSAPASGTASNWVLWSTGELRVDPASYNLCFVPGGSSTFAPKPLGCLISASIFPGEPGMPSSIVANTNDVIHGSVRLTFGRYADEETFMRLAQSVESKRAHVPPRRSSMNGSGADWADADHMQLCDMIEERCAGAWPLIYGGAELYGADPTGNGAEVLLGRGAIVLLDPPETAGREWLGTYDLLFYDDSSSTGEPTLRVPVSPKIKLSPQQEDAHPGRLTVGPRASMTRRMSMGVPDASCFDFSIEGVGVSALTFDRELDAQSFVRDLSVRLRLSRVALKANREIQSVFNLQGQVSSLRHNTITAWAWRCLLSVLALILGVMLFNICILYFSEDRSLTDVVAEVLVNTISTIAALTGGMHSAGTVMCSALDEGRRFSAAAVDTCASMAYAPDAQACIQDLTSRGRIR